MNFTEILLLPRTGRQFSEAFLALLFLLKRISVLKYAPMRTDYVHAVTVDDTSANEFVEVDLPDNIIESEYKEVA